MRYWFHKKCPFRDYNAPAVGNGIYSMEDRATVSLVGDWGTGTDEAEEVANCVREFAPDFSIHLGDVYFVGGQTEIKENYLGEKTSPYDPVKWPMGKKGSFALSGNHEMYARGHGYYDELLPRMGIRAAGSEWGVRPMGKLLLPAKQILEDRGARYGLRWHEIRLGPSARDRQKQMDSHVRGIQAQVRISAAPASVAYERRR